MLKLKTFSILLFAALAALAQAPSPTQWDKRIVGAPVGGCSSSQDVGKRVSRIDAAAANATTYICQNTGAGTYSWGSPIGSGGGSSLTTGPTGVLVITDEEIDVDTAIVPLIATGTNWTGAQNASAAALTAPFRILASAPATCNSAIREFYYNISTRNLFVCDTANTWTLVGGADPSARPTYLWSDMCRRASGTGWPGDLGWQNINGDFTVGAIASQPPCTVSLQVSGSGDNARMYAGDGGDKITRLDTNWDFSFDMALTAQNDKTVRIGVNQGTTVGNDSCWIQGDRVDGTTPYTLYCRQGGVDGTATTMTGTTISATRSTFRIRRVGETVFASINGGTEFSTTSRLPTSTFGGSPMIQWINDVSGAAGTIFVYNIGMGR